MNSDYSLSDDEALNALRKKLYDRAIPEEPREYKILPTDEFDELSIAIGERTVVLTVINKFTRARKSIILHRHSIIGLAHAILQGETS